LDPSISKGKWTAEEESKLLELVGIHGTRKWVEVANAMKNRCDVQCRYHYRKMLRENKPGKSKDRKKIEIAAVAPDGNVRKVVLPPITSIPWR
jgi:hypothetical protein